MKYRSLQYNTAQELESQEYEVTCSVDGMNKCLWPMLSMLEMSRVGCSANRPVPVVYCLCSGSDHTCHHGKCNCSHSTYPANKFRQSVGNSTKQIGSVVYL